MIQLIEGAPGSGKSYFAMNYLVKFTEYDALYNEYILSDDVLIITNIEGLKLKHWSLDYVLKSRSFAEFFSIENFEEIKEKTKKQHIILVVDEAHELFPSGFKDMNIYNFFAFHRHIGLDVVLLTQGIDSLTKMFNPLLEYIVKATPRSKKVSKTFTYKYCDLRGKYLFSKVITAKKTVFGAYQSFRSDEHNKPRSVVLIWITVVVLLFGSGAAGMAYTIKKISNTGQHKPPIVKPHKVLTPENVNIKDVSALAPAPVVVPVVPPEDQWNRISVSGAIKQGDKMAYLINGRVILSDSRFRDYDHLSQTVDYMGREISQAVPASLPESAENRNNSARSDSGESGAVRRSVNLDQIKMIK